MKNNRRNQIGNRTIHDVSDRSFVGSISFHISNAVNNIFTYNGVQACKLSVERV